MSPDQYRRFSEERDVEQVCCGALGSSSRATQPASPDAPRLSDALGFLHQTLEEAHSAMSALEKTLDPVLAPDSPSVNKSGVDAIGVPSSSLIQHVRELNAITRALIMRLHNVHQRAQV